VFFSPTVAILTAIFGLALSAEALYRSKALHWMPVFILQILFSVLQVAWMLHIPGHGLLLAVTIGISMVGMGYERIEQRAGRSTVLIGGVLSVVIWAFFPNVASTLGLIALALAALWIYRRWELLLALYGPLIALALPFGLGTNWRLLLVLGGAQTVIGAALVIATRRAPSARSRRRLSRNRTGRVRSSGSAR
jgi:hypothetical protein